MRVCVEDGDLVIKGEYKVEEKNEYNWFFCSFGSYNICMMLFENIKIDEVKVEFKNGVLYVFVFKLKEEFKKNVNINIE